MLFYAVLAGASAVIGLALHAGARIYIAALPHIGNPALTPRSQKFVGWLTVFVVIVVLSVGTGIALLLRDKASAPHELPPASSEMAAPPPQERGGATFKIDTPTTPPYRV